MTFLYYIEGSDRRFCVRFDNKIMDCRLLIAKAQWMSIMD